MSNAILVYDVHVLPRRFTYVRNINFLPLQLARGKSDGLYKKSIQLGVLLLLKGKKRRLCRLSRMKAVTSVRKYQMYHILPLGLEFPYRIRRDYIFN